MKISIVPFFIISLLSSITYGQTVSVIALGNNSDSSYYHIAKINANEFWVAGENGILKKIDTLGNFRTINFPNEGLNILKIQKVKNYIFIITDNAVIYRYDILNGAFIKKKFKNFEGKCFYDIIELQNGNLLTCGGSKGVSKGAKKIPKGFIAVLDKDLNEINVVWKNYRKFVWSILELDNGDILASTFNGLNTRIIKSDDCAHWKTSSKVNGLAHELSYSDGQIYYSGTRLINYKKDGVLGQIDKSKKEFEGTGCLWSMEFYQNKIVSVSTNGNFLIIDKNSLDFESLKMPFSYSVYDLANISGTKFYIVGHGGLTYLVDVSGIAIKEPSNK